MSSGYFAALPIRIALTPEQIRAHHANRLHRVERICGRLGVEAFRYDGPILAAIEVAGAAVMGTEAVEPDQLLAVMADRVAHLMPRHATAFEQGVALGVALALASELKEA